MTHCNYHYVPGEGRLLGYGWTVSIR
jgi:hypothetical protein